MFNYVYQLVSPNVFSVQYKQMEQEDGVLVRPAYMAICHADQRYFLGQRSAAVLKQKLPMALIHECWGTVICDCGTLKRGQKVVLIPNVPAPGPETLIYENYAKGSGFLSSGRDGFLQEFVRLPMDRAVPFEHIKPAVAAICELVSVAVHGVTRLENLAHAQRESIGIWGDGSLSYIVACCIRALLPQTKVYVVGKDTGKLSRFSFVTDTFLAGNLPADFCMDHAFECAGGEGSYYAIDEMIGCINPQGCIMLMGVSENRVAVDTRHVLEKGLTMVGCSRSGRADFERAVTLMSGEVFGRRLESIIYEDKPVSGMEDLYRVFATDLSTPFKTVFRWNL